jgi:hypothetical protein
MSKCMISHSFTGAWGKKGENIPLDLESKRDKGQNQELALP